MATDYYERLVQEDLDVGTSTAQVRNPGGGTLVGTQIGIHSLAEGQKQTTTTWNPGEIASGSFESVDVTVSGAALGDYVLVSFNLDLTDLQLTANVSATNTVTATLYNLTGSAVNLASGTLAVLVLKSK